MGLFSIRVTATAYDPDGAIIDHLTDDFESLTAVAGALAEMRSEAFERGQCVSRVALTLDWDAAEVPDQSA